MAFDITGFQPIGGQSRTGKAPAIWSYTTTDTLATVRVAGYFNAIRNMLQIGDRIYVVVTSAGALSAAGDLVVKDKSATAVDTTDATSLTITDTD